MNIKTIVKWVMVALAVSMLAGACGVGGETIESVSVAAADSVASNVPAADSVASNADDAVPTAVSTDTGMEPPSCSSVETIIDLVPLGMNVLSNTADLVLVGTVASVSKPRWNTESGAFIDNDSLRKPADDPFYNPLVVRHRTVEISVDRVIAGRDAQLRSAKTVEFVVVGSGEPRGCTNWGQVDLELAGGSFVVGDTHLFLLATQPIPFEGGPREVVGLASGDARTQWLIAGEMAVNDDWGRTVPLALLEQRIEVELDRGLLDPAGDVIDSSQGDPLAADLSRADFVDPAPPVTAPCIGDCPDPRAD